MNPLQQLQEDTATFLLGNPDTAAVSFTSFRKQVIESLQDEAQAAWKVRQEGKVGVAALVLMPSLQPTFPNVPGPQYDLTLVVRTFEDPKVNNTGLSAEDVGLSVLSWLDGLTIEGLTILTADRKGEALSPVYDYPGMLVYDSTLVGPLPRNLTSRTDAPTIQAEGGLVTLGCGDGQALIYYTTDGTMPLPGNAAQLYGAPFEVVTGAVVRWLAWNPAKLPSHVAQGRINF